MDVLDVCNYHILVITTGAQLQRSPLLLAHLDDAAPKAFGLLLHGFTLAGLNPLVELVLEEVDGPALLC